MFTGLIKYLGKLKSNQNKSNLVELNIECKELLEAGLALGDSVAVNGLCLTVTALTSNSFTVQAVYETINRSTVNKWQSGKLLNLERPLTPQSFLDGHLVTGHVDGIGRVLRITPVGDAKKITIVTPAELDKYIAVKGSITLDGISLTVSEKPAGNQFCVAVIPHTFNNTIARTWQSGTEIHLEVDVIARYLEQLQKSNNPAVLPGIYDF